MKQIFHKYKLHSEIQATLKQPHRYRHLISRESLVDDRFLVSKIISPATPGRTTPSESSKKT